jgi:hypothetical protein
MKTLKANIISFLKNNLVLILVFITADIIFNWQIFLELFTKNEYRSFKGDTVILEYFAEYFYKNLLQFKNPFQYSKDLVYPLGASPATSDLGLIHGIYFLFLRPFFSIHKALMMAILVSVFLCEVLMYKLLRYLSLGKAVSILIALGFSFSPFITFPRINQHYTYLHHFVYPLMSWIFLLIWNGREKRKLWVLSVGLGIATALLFYSNQYYFVMYFMLVGVFGILYLFFNRKKEGLKFVQPIKSVFLLFKSDKIDPFKYYLNNFFSKIIYLVFAIIIFSVLALPQLKEIWNQYRIEGGIQNQDLQVTSFYSGNVLSAFLPSPYHPIWGNLISNSFSSIQPIEGVTYPGIIVLIGIFLYMYKYFKEKKEVLIPLFLTTLFFYSLTIGPFLRFFNSRSQIPFIYYFLAKFPLTSFISSLRSPTRFVVPMVFCGCILIAYVFDDYLKNHKKKVLILGMLFLALVIDQSYRIPKKHLAEDMNLPLRSYELIKKDPENCTVFEIPYGIQDGMSVWGRNFHPYNMIGQLIHGKKIIGSYLSRLPYFTFSYYKFSPALGYYGYFSSADRLKFPPYPKPNDDSLKSNLEFLNTKYVVIDKRLDVNSDIKKDLEILGYETIFDDDNGFILLSKQYNLKEFNSIDFTSKDIFRFYGEWSEVFQNLRFMGEKGGILITNNDNKIRSIKFKALGNQRTRKLKIFVNNKFLKELEIQPGINEYLIDSVPYFENGMNKIFFSSQLNKKADPNDIVSVGFKDLLVY